MRYEKGRKDASRGRIMEVAADRFRSDGIAASGLATIMSDAGLTNGAFYPHFQSKAELVRESVAAAMEIQSQQLAEALASGGPEMGIEAYLSAEHRDNPGKGCASAALLPELGRQPPETRKVYTNHLLTLVRQLAAALPQAPARRNPRCRSFAANLCGATASSTANGIDAVVEAGAAILCARNGHGLRHR